MLKFGKYTKVLQELLEVILMIENEMKVYNEGDQIVLQQGERHRLIGLDETCVVAEIWQHTDATILQMKTILLECKMILVDKKKKMSKKKGMIVSGYFNPNTQRTYRVF